MTVKLGPADRRRATLPPGPRGHAAGQDGHDRLQHPALAVRPSGGAGRTDGLNNTLTRTVDLTGATSGSVSAWLQYNIEQDYDYLYAEVSTDGGATWKDAAAPISGPSDNAGLTPWAQKSWDLTPYAGKSVQFRFRYATDGGLHFEGPFLDDLAITVGGTTVYRRRGGRRPTAGRPTGSPA